MCSRCCCYCCALSMFSHSYFLLVLLFCLIFHCCCICIVSFPSQPPPPVFDPAFPFFFCTFFKSETPTPVFYFDICAHNNKNNNRYVWSYSHLLLSSTHLVSHGSLPSLILMNTTLIPFTFRLVASFGFVVFFVHDCVCVARTQTHIHIPTTTTPTLTI